MPTTRSRLLALGRTCALLTALSSHARAQQGAMVAAQIDEDATRSAHVQTLSTGPIGSVPEGFERLTLAPGCLLQMDVFGVPEMSAQLRVDVDGNIAIPLAGSLHVADETATEAQTTVAKALVDREILKDPQVSLNILQYPARRVSVLGEVQVPGRVPLLAPAPLGDVLALAGGETIASGNEIEIQHRNENGTIVMRHVPFARDGDASVRRTTIVEPGETVLVRRAGIVYVLGAVNRPGGYRMVNRGSLNVVKALSLAGGQTLQSSMQNAVIVRRHGDDLEQIKVPLGSMEKGEIPAVSLQANDALFVPASNWKSLVINGSNVLSAAAAATIYAASSHP